MVICNIIHFSGHFFNNVRGPTASFTSFPGGNMVDALPPAISLYGCPSSLLLSVGIGNIFICMRRYSFTAGICACGYIGNGRFWVLDNCAVCISGLPTRV